MSIREESSIWNIWLEQLAFLNSLDDKILRMHVGFGFYLGAPIASDIWNANMVREKVPGSNAIRERIISDQKRLTKNIDKKYHWSEPDVSASNYSILDQENRYINSDVLRTQADLSNLINLDLLKPEQELNVLEIGGGYGMLAAAITTLFPNVKYTIIDFPTILKIQERFLKYIGVDMKRVIFVSNIENNNHNRSYDLGININSFCEMKESSVLSYLQGDIGSFDVFYSSNRERQFQNHDLTTALSNLFSKFGKLYPTPEDYSPHKEALKKYVYVLYRNEFKSEVKVTELHGVFGAEMPNLEKSQISLE